MMHLYTAKLSIMASDAYTFPISEYLSKQNIPLKFIKMEGDEFGKAKTLDAQEFRADGNGRAFGRHVNEPNEMSSECR